MAIPTAAAALIISTNQQAKNNDTKATELVINMLAGAVNGAAQSGKQYVQYDTRNVAKFLVSRYGYGNTNVDEGVTTAVVIIVNPNDPTSFYDLAPSEVTTITTTLNGLGYTTSYDPSIYTYLVQW